MRFFTVFLACTLACAAAHATTVSIGSGSAVTTVDRTATFDAITTTGLDLSAYTEDSLNISVADTSLIGFDPFQDGTTTAFYYGDEGNTSFVSISTTDGSQIAALELKVGDGWANATTNVIWKTLVGGIATDSGALSTLDSSVIGWLDLGGFDELRIAASGDTLNPITNFGDFQGVALDDVKVQLVPIPAAVWLFGSTLAALGWAGRRRDRTNFSNQH